jgi:transmembrane sensor
VNSAAKNTDAVARAAAAWLARRDRGLSAAEQDDYLQWLRRDPRHAAAVAQHEAALRRMMRLGEWQPAQSDAPNPDLFAPSPRRRLARTLVLAGCATAAIAAGLWIGFGWPARHAGLPAAPAVAAKNFLRVNERLALPDGSVVELRDGSHVAVEFSAGERRVRLDGEAHFTVARDAARPFVVAAEGVSVRAIGTAFNVRHAPAAVEVLVTEGRVGVERVDPKAIQPPAVHAPQRLEVKPLHLDARQRAVVSLAPAAPPPQVDTLTPREIERVLAWQHRLLDFTAAPLAEIVAAFNRRNAVQLVVADPELAGVRISATLRSDNLDGFVALLEAGFGARAERRGEAEIILRKAP